MQTLIAERIHLRTLTLDDSPFIFELLNTPEWLRFIGDLGIKTLKDAEDYLISGPMHGYLLNGFGFQCMVLNDTGEKAGICGLIKRDSLPTVDIGFAMLPEFAGKGLAYDAALLTLDFARNQLEQKQVLAITVRENSRSINLLKRLGFIEDGTTVLPGEEVVLLRWLKNL